MDRRGFLSCIAAVALASHIGVSSTEEFVCQWAWDPYLEEWYHAGREPMRHMRIAVRANALTRNQTRGIMEYKHGKT